MRHEYFAEIDGPQSFVAPGRRVILRKGDGGDQRTTQEIPAELKPLAERYTELGLDLSNTPWAPYTGTRYAGLSEGQEAGIASAMDRARGSQSADTLKQMMSAGPNPYLDEMVSRAQDSVTSAFNTSSVNSGSFGNSGLQEQFAKQLGGVATDIYGGAYDADQNRRLQAANQAFGQDMATTQQLLNVGQLQQDQAQQGLDFDYSQFQEQQNDPYKKLAGISGVFGSYPGGSTTTSGGGK